jgi:hypothetical protein
MNDKLVGWLVERMQPKFVEEKKRVAREAFYFIVGND